MLAATSRMSCELDSSPFFPATDLGEEDSFSFLASEYTGSKSDGTLEAAWKHRKMFFDMLSIMHGRVEKGNVDVPDLIEYKRAWFARCKMSAHWK